MDARVHETLTSTLQAERDQLSERLAARRVKPTRIRNTRRRVAVIETELRRRRPESVA